MADNKEVSAKIAETLGWADRCLQAENSEGYDGLNEQLEELETLVKKSFETHADYKALLSKLEQGASLTPDELNTLKLLLVGDADYYLKYDDDFDRSEGELKKILEEIRKLPSSELDVDALMHLRVLCREACSVARPTAFYLEQKERVGKFEEATRDGIDRESGKFLANIIKSMMSPDNP
ncbi:MAG: hypothetical protein WCA19_04660 [Candidatus Acidiferrales bacterium]